MPFARRPGSLLVFLLVAALALLAGCERGHGPPERTRDPGPGPAPAAAAELTDRDAPQFAPGRLEEHFAKHGAEMGIATQDEYLRRAQALVRGGPGVETLQQGGDTLFFREETGEFAVLSSRNVIRTYFRPDDGRRYWERQKRRQR